MSCGVTVHQVEVHAEELEARAGRVEERLMVCNERRETPLTGSRRVPLPQSRWKLTPAGQLESRYPNPALGLTRTVVNRVNRYHAQRSGIVVVPFLPLQTAHRRGFLTGNYLLDQLGLGRPLEAMLKHETYGRSWFEVVSNVPPFAAGRTGEQQVRSVAMRHMAQDPLETMSDLAGETVMLHPTTSTSELTWRGQSLA